MVPYMQEIGLSPLSTAIAFSFFGIGLASGQFSFSWVSDYVHPRHILTFSLLLQMTIILLLTFTINAATPVLLLGTYVALFGFGMGGTIPTLPLMVNKYFGIRSYGTLLGILSLFFWIGAAMGPMIAGFVHDANGDYFLSFMMFIVLHTITLITMLSAVHR